MPRPSWTARATRVRRHRDGGPPSRACRAPGDSDRRRLRGRRRRAGAGRRRGEREISVLVVDRQGNRDRDDDEPVEGAVIVVTDAAGDEVDEVETDEEGRATISCRARASTSPRSTSTRSPTRSACPARAARSSTSIPTAAARSTFNLGARERTTSGTFDRAPAAALRRAQLRPDHRHHVGRPVADLRHHRPGELLPRRARHLGRDRRLVDQRRPRRPLVVGRGARHRHRRAHRRPRRPAAVEAAPQPRA